MNQHYTSYYHSTLPRPMPEYRASKKPRSHGKLLLLITIVVIAVIATSGLTFFNIVKSRAAAAAIPEIKSGIYGYCLDDHDDSDSAGNTVDSWPCNGTKAQDWSISGENFTHGKIYCLSESSSSGDYGAVLNKCDGTASQQWTVDGDGYQNVASGQCLVVPDNTTGVQLSLANCSGISNASYAWMTAIYGAGKAPSGLCTGTEGEKVACVAEQQYSAWVANPKGHTALLNSYTDGSAYEEWCADFVSYVYKQAGFPFTQGERGGGWDEYNANNLQHFNGFIVHQAGSYAPKPGDIAWFNYPGGHVEVVVAGGKNPTFIYGDSGVNDPATNNGQMEENTVTSDGSQGQVEYYLSPN